MPAPEHFAPHMISSKGNQYNASFLRLTNNGINKQKDVRAHGGHNLTQAQDLRESDQQTNHSSNTTVSTRKLKIWTVYEFKDICCKRLCL